MDKSNLISKVCGYIGAAAMAVAPFQIDTTEGKLIAIFGLTFLTVQAIDNRLWNLVGLNLISIGGFAHAIYF
jgi:hypothetical protein